MIGCAFIAYCAGWYDHMSDGDVPVQHTCSTAGDKFFTAQGDQFFQECGPHWCAQSGMKHCQALTLEIDLVNWIDADFTAQLMDTSSQAIAAHLGDDFLEKAQHTVFRHI